MNFVHYFIHPRLRTPQHPDYRKGVIFAYASLVVAVFLTIYDTYFFVFHPDDSIKIWTNILGTLVFIAGFLNFRFRSDLKKTLATFTLLCSPFALVSIYHTGGIYSVDIIWILLLIVSTYLFIDTRTGNMLTLLLGTYLFILYILDLRNVSSFKRYILENNATHNIFTYIFVLGMLSVLLISFNSVLQKTNNRLQQLKQEKITALEEKIKEKTEEIGLLRQELAKDFHDEMGNKLASITILSQSIHHKLDNGQVEEIQELLHNIEERSLQLYHGTKDFIWSIDIKSDYVEDWFVYIRDFGEDFFGKLGVSFLSETSLSDQHNLMFAPTIGRQLVYILKEAMTNAAKHAGCTQVYLSVAVTGSNISIIFSDNGIGFDIGHVKSRGLKHIQERVKKIEGKLEIRSDKNTGTFIRITLSVVTTLINPEDYSYA